METQVSKAMRTVSDLPFTLGWPAQVDILTALLLLSSASASSNRLTLLSRSQSPGSSSQCSGLPVCSQDCLLVFQLRLRDAAPISRSVELRPLFGAARVEGRLIECGRASTRGIVSAHVQPSQALPSNMLAPADKTASSYQLHEQRKTESPLTISRHGVVVPAPTGASHRVAVVRKR